MLKNIAWSILLNALALYLVFLVVDVVDYSQNFKFFLIAGCFLGVINGLVKPAIKLIALPLIIVSGGVLLILINFMVLWLLVQFIAYLNLPDVTLVFPNTLSYVISAIVFGIINWAENLFHK